VQKFKPDMQASKKMKETSRDRIREGIYGHIPGVAVGAAFVGRGELDMLGLHSNMMKGIDYK
jgi:hypothetical protein